MIFVTWMIITSIWLVREHMDLRLSFRMFPAEHLRINPDMFKSFEMYAFTRKDRLLCSTSEIYINISDCETSL